MEDERGLLLKQILVWNTLLVMMMWNTVLGPKLTFVYVQSVLYIGHLKISDNKINCSHTQKMVGDLPKRLIEHEDSVDMSVHVTDVILLDKPDTCDEDDKLSASEALQLTVNSGLKPLTIECSKLITGDDCTGEVVQVSVASRLEAASCSLSLEVDCTLA